MKAAGIGSLGAVLDRSEHMLCLVSAGELSRQSTYIHPRTGAYTLPHEHSPDYFDRLWCVFELASYVHRQGTERLILLPPDACRRVIAIVMLGSWMIYMASLSPDQSSLVGIFVWSLLPMVSECNAYGNYLVVCATGLTRAFSLQTAMMSVVLNAAIDARKTAQALQSLYARPHQSSAPSPSQMHIRCVVHSDSHQMQQASQS